MLFFSWFWGLNGFSEITMPSLQVKSSFSNRLSSSGMAKHLLEFLHFKAMDAGSSLQLFNVRMSFPNPVVYGK
jgi:hypothetical protein